MSSPTRDRADVIDAGMAGLQKWSLRIVSIAAAAFVLGWAVGHVWMVAYPVAMALIVATVLAPPAAFLRRRGFPAGLSAAAVMITFFAAVTILIAVLTPQVAGQVPAIADSASSGLLKVRDWLTDGPLKLTDGQLTRAVSALQDKLQSSASAISSGALSTVSAATGAVVNLVLILMLTFFFIKDGHKFLPWARALAGRRGGDHVVEVLSRIWSTLGGFIRTQTLVALIDAVIIGTGLAILGVPLAIPLAVITFIGGYIPIIGAFVSGVLAVLVTLVTNDPKDALIAALIVIGVQQLEGNVLSPWLQGKNMNLHAGVVLLSVTAGGSLFGITGAFLAVPVAASTAELLRYLNEQIDRSVSADAPAEDGQSAEILREGPSTLEPPTSSAS